MTTKEEMFEAGKTLLWRFCSFNSITPPTIERLSKTDDRRYWINTCAYYRSGIICIMVEKCAHRGTGGRAWSWPGYVIDRTPYGVLQHELGHHVDELLSVYGALYSEIVYRESKEPPLTGYLGTDKEAPTFFKEWFAENFRLFVTNPDLSRMLRPKFFSAVCAIGLKPLKMGFWETPLFDNGAPPRITEQARKKIVEVQNQELKEICG